MDKTGIESAMDIDDMRVRLLLPEIHLNQLSTTWVGRSDDMSVLEKFLKENVDLPEEDKINLLKQIEYCMMRLHNEEFTCNELTHSQIFIMKNFFKNATSNKISQEQRLADVQSDVQSLANLYCFILTSGKICEYSENLTEGDLKCSYPDVALDIIQQMADGRIATIEQALEHPFHWNDPQKVLFICKAVDYINAKHKDLNKNKKSDERKRALLKKYEMGDQVDVVSEKGWIEMLKLTKQEMKGKSKQKSAKQYDVKLERELIYDLALKPEETKGHREKLVYELLRFFRNRYSHYYEDTEDVKMCFGSYPTGYLEFFSSRFPKLFMHVYKNMKTYLCKEGNIEEFVPQKFNQCLCNVNMHVRCAGSSN